MNANIPRLKSWIAGYEQALAEYPQFSKGIKASLWWYRKCLKQLEEG